MTYKPLVSVIINCYNSEKYLRETIDSLISQSYNKWEAIFWDNCSTDKTAEIIVGYNESRFRYYLAEKNTPLGEARNRAMSHIQGDYFCFLDSDDIWDVDFLNIGVKALSANNNVIAFYSNYYEWSDEKTELHNRKRKSGVHSFSYVLRNYGLGISAVLMKSDVVRIHNIHFSPNYKLVEDMDFFYKIASVGDFIYDERPLYKYRIYPENNTAVLKNKWIGEYEDLYNSMISNYIRIDNPIIKKKDLSYITDRIFNRKAEEYIERNQRCKMLKLLVSSAFSLHNMKYLLFVVLGRSVYYKIRAKV